MRHLETPTLPFVHMTLLFIYIDNAAHVNLTLCTTLYFTSTLVVCLLSGLNALLL